MNSAKNRTGDLDEVFQRYLDKDVSPKDLLVALLPELKRCVAAYFREFPMIQQSIRHSDFLQDIAIKLQSGLSTRAFESLGKLFAWVKRVLRHMALDEARRRKPKHVEGLEEALGDFRDGGERSRIREVVLAALDRLEEPTRQIIIWRYLEGWERRQIAEVLELSEAQVYRRVFSGLARLRELLGSEAG